MTTVQRRLPVVFTDPTDLPVFVPSLGVSGVLRRYVAAKAGEAGVALNAEVSNLASIGSTATTVTASGTTRPLLISEGGRLLLRFDGTDDRMPSGSGDGIGTNPFTLYGVAKFRALPSSGFAGIIGYGSGTGYQLGISNTGASTIYRGSTLTGTTVTAGTWHVFVGVFDGASSTLRVDSTETGGSVGTGSMSSGVVNLAPVAGGASASAVDIAEAGIFARALNSTERATLAGNLAASYGL